jgi:hypothetical protein
MDESNILCSSEFRKFYGGTYSGWYFPAAKVKGVNALKPSKDGKINKWPDDNAELKNCTYRAFRRNTSKVCCFEKVK